jgi:hypothetical protein
VRATLVLVAAVACGGSSRSVDKPAPQLVMLDAGSEPRQVMRYELAAGMTARSEYQLRSTIEWKYTSTTLEEGQRRSEARLVQFVAQVQVSSITRAGDAMMRGEIEGTGVVTTWRMAPSGRAFDIQIEPRDRPRLANLRDWIEQAASELPAVPIGVGARWQTSSSITTAGVVWTSVATHTLRACDGEVATIDSTVALRAASQALSTEPNASTRLTSGEASYASTLVAPLRRLGAELTAQGTLELNFAIVRRKVRATSTLLITQELAAAPL